jgi:hypothetical protein
MKKRKINSKAVKETDSEIKTPWEWFDTVQNKLASDHKMVVKRIGKKHKW